MNNKAYRCRFLLGIVCMAGIMLTAMAQEPLYEAPEVEIVGTRPGTRTPVTKQVVNVKDLTNKSTAWDVPTLLRGLPSVVVANESGVMGGYTSFTIRGIDASRINITNMGVPLNDGESHAVFWANMPDYGSRLRDIVLVRGAGSSSFGAGAFGATIDMRSNRTASRAGGAIGTFLGAYGLQKYTANIETGRLNNGWAFSSYLSKIMSDGYVDRSGGNGLSYFLQASWIGDGKSFDLIHNAGKQKTGISWNGLSPENLETFGRRFNENGLMLQPYGLTKETQLNYFMDNTDNYEQSHTYAIWKQELSHEWHYGITAHYTRGEGFTKEYKPRVTLHKYNLAPVPNNALGIKKAKSDVVRNKFLDNHFFGGIANIEYKGDRVRASFGLSGNYYTNDHYGIVSYIKDPVQPYSPEGEYYRNNSKRTDIATYIKGEYDITDRLTIYGDLMYRYLNHKMEGPSDRFNERLGKMDLLDYDLDYNFFLPKIGLTMDFTSQLTGYASFSMAGKEPNRKAYTEGSYYNPETKEMVYPNPEYLNDFELGISFNNGTVECSLNGYYMDYKDQLIPGGRMSDVGEPILINAPKSFRTGIEAALLWNITHNFFASANATLSKNILKDFTMTDYDMDGDNPRTFDVGDVEIAMSPSLIANHSFGWRPVEPLTIILSGNYVGKQYLDNSGLDGRSLDAYYVGNLMMNYDWELSGNKALRFKLQINNLYNSEFATKGYSWAYYEEKGENVEHKQSNYIFPAAPLHLVGGITFEF